MAAGGPTRRVVMVGAAGAGKFPLVLGRLTARTLRRGITREVLWNDNRENLWEHALPFPARRSPEPTR